MYLRYFKLQFTNVFRVFYKWNIYYALKYAFDWRKHLTIASWLYFDYFRHFACLLLTHVNLPPSRFPLPCYIQDVIKMCALSNVFQVPDIFTLKRQATWRHLDELIVFVLFLFYLENDQKRLANNINSYS